MNIFVVILIVASLIVVYFTIALINKGIYIENLNLKIDGQGIDFCLKSKQKKNESGPARRPRSKRKNKNYL